MKKTIAPFGSKPVPVIVNWNACAATSGLGVVVMVVICGTTVEEAETFSVTPFDAVPLDPFWTVTVKAPPASVAVPLSCVELLFDSAPFPILQEDVEVLQPGPLKITTAVFASKLVPVTVKVNGCQLRGGLGVEVIALSFGGPKETVNGKPSEGVPLDPF